MKQQLHVLTAIAEDLRRAITGYDVLASLSGEFRDAPEWQEGRHVLEAELAMVTAAQVELKTWLPAA